MIIHNYQFCSRFLFVVSIFLPDSSESAWSRLTDSLGFTALSEVLCSTF